VIVTMTVVATVVHVLAPAVGWAPAFVLGAIVSPPDPVAATAVLRPLGAPRDVTTMLEGEGLINDATALVLYRLAVAAVVAGTFSLGDAAWRLAVTGVIGAIIGLAAGVFVVFLRRRITHIVVVENALSLLSPFLAFLPAQALHGSGVLAVVAMGVYLGTQAPRAVAPATRLQAGAMWSMVTFLLESLIFMLVGLELPRVMVVVRTHPLHQLLALVLATTLACIVVRFIWVFLSIHTPGVQRRLHAASAKSRWKKPFFVAWAGLRGADSLVIALALPLTIHGGAAFPARDLIIFVTFGVIFMTLVVQGFSLAPLVRRLGLRGDGGEASEERVARIAMADAALERLREIAKQGHVPIGLVRRMRAEYQQRKRSAKRTHVPEGRGAERAADHLEVRRELHAAEREALIRLAERGTIGGDVMRHLQRQQDLRDMLLSYDEEASGDSHEHLASGDDFSEDPDEERGEEPG
jgi:CPA1 family monovalent cation:H+ antiporter